MTRKERLDLAGYSILTLCLFALFCMFAWAAHKDSQRRFDLHANGYVYDRQLTAKECFTKVKTLAQWTGNEAVAHCTRTR